MKRFILTLVSMMSLVIVNAQNPVPKTYPKTIQVAGTAEMEIVPNEIHVMVTLKEYEKKGRPKTDIETIRKVFLASVRKAGVADSSISIVSIGGNSSIQWWKKKQKDELYASVSYEIIFNEPSKIDKLVSLLDDDGTENFAVTEITHSNMKNLQKQLRSDALKAAKEKAIFLAASIEETVGSAITITESSVPVYYSRVANTMSFNQTADASSESVSNPEFKKLLIKSEMNVVFELK